MSVHRETNAVGRGTLRSQLLVSKQALFSESFLIKELSGEPLCLAALRRRFQQQDRPGNLLLQVDRVLRHLIKGRDHAGVGLITALGDNQAGEFPGDIDIRLLKRSAGYAS